MGRDDESEGLAGIARNKDEAAALREGGASRSSSVCCRIPPNQAFSMESNL